MLDVTVNGGYGSHDALRPEADTTWCPAPSCEGTNAYLQRQHIDAQKNCALPRVVSTKLCWGTRSSLAPEGPAPVNASSVRVSTVTRSWLGRSSILRILKTWVRVGPIRYRRNSFSCRWRLRFTSRP
jgi:hypothetical protein